ncbi:MAG TPA: hypothetical protein VLJ15_07060 [Gammaproteobacteria bacterium]|nr:hypothetical protein [Gammaproteobacteria bacterium]
MTQLNIHMTPGFERELAKFMKIRHLKTKAEAVRIAIKEGLEHSVQAKPTDFSAWVGIGKEIPNNKKPRFHSDDDLWRS